MDRFNSHVIIEGDNQYTVLTKDPINLIAFGDGYTSLVSKNHFVYSFGKNDQGQLGASDDIKYSKSLILSYETESEIVKIVCGLRHTLLLTSDGHIITWGDSTLGQCGFGQSEIVCYPKRLSNHSNSDEIYIDISVGPNYSLALTNTKSILFWGSYGKTLNYVPEILFKTDEPHTSPYALISFDSFVYLLSMIACPICYPNKNINMQKLKILGNNVSLCGYCNKAEDKTSNLTNNITNTFNILDCSYLCCTKCICHLTQLKIWEINEKSNKFEANITLQSLYLNNSLLYMGITNNLCIGLGMYGLLYMWQFEKETKKPIVLKFLDYLVWDLCLTKEYIWLSTIDYSKTSNICLWSIDSNTLIDHIIYNKAAVNSVLTLNLSNLPSAQYHKEFGIPCAYAYQNNKLSIITHTIVEEKEKCKTSTLSYKLWDEHIHTFVELEILALTLNSFQTHCFDTISQAFKDDREDKVKTFQKFGQNSPDVSLLFTLLCQKLALLFDSNTTIALLFRDVINSQPNIHEFVQMFIESSMLNELYNVIRDVVEHLCNFVVSTYNINPELNMEKFTEGLPQLIRSYVGIGEFDKAEPLNVFTSVTFGIVSKTISVILNFVNHLIQTFEIEPLFFEILERQKTVKDVNRKILKESKESWEKIRSHLQNGYESASNTCIFWKGASFCLQENLYHPSRRFIMGSKSDSAAQGEGLNMGSLTGSVSSLYNFLRGGRSSGSSPSISCLAAAEEDRQPTTPRSESRNSPSRNLKIYSPSAASKLMGNYLFNPVYYLFNDKFVSFHPPTTIKSYDLLTLWLQPLEEGSLSFTLKSPEEFIKVTATSQEAKSIWVRAINRATRNLILRQSSAPTASPRIEWEATKAFPSKWRQILASPSGITLSYPSDLGDQGQGSHAPEIRHTGYTFTKDKVVFYVDVPNCISTVPVPDQLFVTNLEGATYRGAWLNGMMHGRGRLVFKDGKKYGGQFKQNAFNGLGTLKILSASSSQSSPGPSPIRQQAGTTNRDWSDGMNQYDCVQEGWWMDGKLNGYGSVRYKNGETYQGYFREGAKNGFGKWRQGNSSANGPPCNASFYIGQWSNDQRKGYGIMDNLNEGEKYIGMWDGDQYNGPGIVAIIDGLYYEGQFKQGKLEGKGFMAMENGTLFEGEIVGPGHFGGSGRLIVPKSDDSVLLITGRFGGSWTTGITMNEATLVCCEPSLVGDGSHEFPILENYYVHHHNNSLGVGPCSDGENVGNFKGFPDGGEADTSPNIISSHYYMDQGELQALIRERDVCWNFVFEPTLLELGLSPAHFTIQQDTLLAQPDVIILSEKTLNRCEKCWQHMTTSIDQRKRYDKEFDKKKESILPSGLELIPDAMKQATLSLSEYYWIVSYVNKALDASSLHPFGALMDRIVEVFRASYVGIGAHPRLLSRAVSDVHIITTKFYTILRALFPNLPATGVVIKADNRSQVETSSRPENISPDLMATPSTTPTVDNSRDSFRSFSKLKRGLKSRNLSSSTISLPMTLLRNINTVGKADLNKSFSTKSNSHASLEEERKQKFGAATHGHEGTERRYGTKGTKLNFPRHYCVPEEGEGNQLISDTGNDPPTSDHTTIACAYVSEHALLQPLLLPRIYPALFTLYALHFQAEDRDYYRKVTRMNKFKETFLLELLGVPKKFWAPLEGDVTTKEEESPSTNISETTEGATRPKYLYYENAIETLQQISTAFSPLEKLQVIGDTYDSINKEVESRHQGDINRHVWSMDDLFPLFLYVVVKARLSRLGSETHYVQDLMEPKLQYGKLGLLFTTLKACYYQIQTEKNRV